MDFRNSSSFFAIHLIETTALIKTFLIKIS